MLKRCKAGARRFVDGKIRAVYNECNKPAQEGCFHEEDGVTAIGKGNFWLCESLTQIEIPDSVTIIGESAFAECTSLAQIEIPASVTTIGAGVFWYCSSLTQVTIPASVTEIGGDLFFVNDEIVLTVERGSAAETYAEENGIDYVYAD